jgi:hypothetical protein
MPTDPFRPAIVRRPGLGLIAGAIAIGPASAVADPRQPSFSVAARETADLWDNVAGGVRSGAVMLNKLQISGSVSRPFGIAGLSVHAQIFRTDGGSLSVRTGDIQTVSNIEAPRASPMRAIRSCSGCG